MICHEFSGLLEGLLVSRSKRFLCRVFLPSSEEVTAYICNTGSMMGMCRKGARLKLRFFPKEQFPKRTLRYSVEAVNVRGEWVGCNTSLPNQILKKLFSLPLEERKKIFPSLPGFSTFRSEVQVGEGKGKSVALKKSEITKKRKKQGGEEGGEEETAKEKSRLDFLFHTPGEEGVETWVEVKMVTMCNRWWEEEQEETAQPRRKGVVPPFRPPECRGAEEEEKPSLALDTFSFSENVATPQAPPEEQKRLPISLGLFPDACTLRGQKHLKVLDSLAAPPSSQSLLLFFVARGDVQGVAPSSYCDSRYAQILKEVVEKGRVQVRCLSFQYEFVDGGEGRVRLVRDDLPLLFRE